MDTIKEYPIDPKLTESKINVPANSTVLSARYTPTGKRIEVGVLVDLDSDEMEEKTILVFEPHEDIEDDMKAKFIGVATGHSFVKGVQYFEEVFYVFEKLR